MQGSGVIDVQREGDVIWVSEPFGYREGKAREEAVVAAPVEQAVAETR